MVILFMLQYIFFTVFVCIFTHFFFEKTVFKLLVNISLNYLNAEVEVLPASLGYLPKT